MSNFPGRIKLVPQAPSSSHSVELPSTFNYAGQVAGQAVETNLNKVIMNLYYWILLKEKLVPKAGPRRRRGKLEFTPMESVLVLTPLVFTPTLSVPALLPQLFLQEFSATCRLEKLFSLSGRFRIIANFTINQIERGVRFCGFVVA